MRRWMIGAVTALTLAWCGSWANLAADEKGGDAKAAPGGSPESGMKRADGRVKDIDLKIAKLAVEVEVEEGKPAQIMIFLLTKDTKVREREHIRGVDDLHIGNRVIVFFKPGEPATKEKKETLPTALFIRIMDQEWRGGKHK